MPGPVLNQNFKRLAHTLVLWMPLWLGTTCACGLFGGIYAFFLKQDLWLSSQAFLVRDEANTASLRVGRFDSDQQMKAAQETILEVARHEQVVQAAMKAVGPEKSWIPSFFSSRSWPSSSAVKATANSLIAIRAPKGAEFGATEVIYLDVKQTSPERALQFNQALTNALQIRLQEVRRTRADSLRTELALARDLARDYLKQTTEQLQKIERDAGVELSDLRGMTDMIAGGGTSRIHLDQLKSEIRVVETKLQEQIDDLSLLEEAIADPQAFVVAPSSVIMSQPGLKRLREGYAEAALNSSQLSGKFTEFHPLLEAARRTQDSIQNRLLTELEASRTNLHQEIDGSKQKLSRLLQLKNETEKKLSGLAEHRAEYANLVAEIKSRTTILETAERELAEVEAASNASTSTSLISKLEEPTISEKPIGPGRTTITGSCALAGLFLGLGLVFVLSPTERRFGRRASDVGRRESDVPAVSQAPSNNADLIASTLAVSGTLLDQIGDPEVSRESASESLASDTASARVNRTLNSFPIGSRPAPVLYDETTIAKLRNKDASFKSPTNVGSANTSVEDSASSSIQSHPKTDRGSNSEHPSDHTFRELLMEEFSKTNERRQHPRPAQPSAPQVQVGIRPSPRNQE